MWGLGFLCFIAPTVLGAQSPEVLALIQQAIDSDREIARLLLEEESAAIQEEQADLSSHKAVSVSASPLLRLDPGRDGETLSGTPSATFRFGEEGKTSLDISSRYSLALNNPESLSLSPSLSVSHQFEDLFNFQEADSKELEKERSSLNRAQSLKRRQSQIASDLMTALKNLIDQERSLISAEQELEDAKLERENLVNVQRRPPASLQVLQADDKIASAEFDIQNIRRNQELTVETVQRLTGIEGLSVEALVNIDLPDPAEVEIQIQGLVPEHFASVRLAELDYEVQRRQEEKSREKNAVNLALTAGGDLSLSASSNSTITGGAFGRAQISEADNWSASLELGYKSTLQGNSPDPVQGLYFSLGGSWSPGSNANDSEQKRLAAELASLGSRRSELALEGAREDAENSIQDFQNQIEQLELNEGSWKRRLAIAQASVEDALRAEEAGLGGQGALAKAERNLETLLLQGRTFALNRLILIQNIERNIL